MDPSAVIDEVVAASEEEELQVLDEPEDLSNLTPIQNRYAFWYRYDSGKGTTNYSNYNQSIKKISSFQSIERFWTVYDHMKRPAEYKDIKAVEYHLFKDGISPFWEDAQNKTGGKWMLRLRKGIAARYWEDILLAIIGEQFDVGAEICGAVLSVRSNEDIISIWNRTAENQEAVNKIRDQIIRIVRLPSVIPLEYKVHASSLQDRSSYRNPNVVFRPTRQQNDRRFGQPHTRGGAQGGEGGDREGGSGYQRGHHNNQGQDRRGWQSGGTNTGGTRWSNDRSGAGGGGGGSGGYHHSNNSHHHQQRDHGEDKEGGNAEGGNARREHHRERGEQHHGTAGRDASGGDGGGWRRSRGDGEGTQQSSNSQTQQKVESKPSSAYTASSGSFASRLRGDNAGNAGAKTDAPPPAPQLTTAGGATLVRVKLPFGKSE